MSEINKDLLMELADCGNPEKLAKIIHQYIPPAQDGSTNLQAVAEAVGIAEISYEESNQFEGLLVTSADKNKGAITINSKSHPYRQRFTLSHELGHFVIPTHEKNATCLTSHLKAEKTKWPFEAEANSFASELLMPSDKLNKKIESHIGPEFEKIFSLAELYQVSKEAMIRKYISLTSHNCAIIFGKDNKMFGFPVRTSGFPFIDIQHNQKLPPHITQVLEDLEEGAITDWFEVDHHFFLSSPERIRGGALFAQLHRQTRGFCMTLLSLENN